MIITKEKALILLNKAVTEYKNNLVGNNVLFLAIGGDHKPPIVKLQKNPSRSG